MPKRKAMVLSNRQGAMRVGVDLGGSHIALGIIDDDNNIVKKYEKDFSAEEKDKIKNTNGIMPIIEDFIIEKINEIEKNSYENSENFKSLEHCTNFDCTNFDYVNFIGIAVPGVTKNGTILKAVNLGIENYNIAESIMNRLEFIRKEDCVGKIKIEVHNDAKCAAMAEYKNMVNSGEINKNSNMLFLGIGTGIGGGFIYKGELFGGNMYEGTEFGHIIIKENGIPCKCGKNGCFERYGSILEFKNKVKQRLNIDNSINGEPLRDIMNLHIDELADLKNEYVQDLAIGISNLINIFEPDVIVIGGGFTHFAYMFMDDLKSALINSQLLFNERDDIDLRIAKLGNDAGMIGSVIF